MHKDPPRASEHAGILVEDGVGHELSRVHRVLKRLYKDLLQTCGLTERQAAVLWMLFENDGASATYLVQQLDSDSSTVGSILDRLEERALVRRDTNPDDRRANRIWLTPAALELKTRLLEGKRTLKQLFSDTLSPEETVLFFSALEKIRIAAETFAGTAPVAEPD